MHVESERCALCPVDGAERLFVHAKGSDEAGFHQPERGRGDQRAGVVPGSRDGLIPECANTSKQHMTNAVNEFREKGTSFEIYPAGDVRLTRRFESREPELASILRKAAWDALQPRLTDEAVLPGSRSVASRRYLYWPDTFVEGMDVAATAMHVARDVQIGNANCALLEYKQVFSPTEVEAYVETRSRASDFTGTTVVTRTQQRFFVVGAGGARMVYLRRKRTIDNRLMLKYMCPGKKPIEQAAIWLRRLCIAVVAGGELRGLAASAACL